MNEWPSEERRQLESLIDERIRLRLAENATEERRKMESHFADLKKLLMSAFPAGPEKHFEYHQEQIEFMRERRELWRSLREKSLAGLVWAGILAVGSALWHYVKTKLGAPL